MASASYNARKAAQVIAYLAMKAGHARLPVLKAVKLVYLADRESLSRFGFPLLEEPQVSMPHGPVNSTTYSHINGEEDLENGQTFLRIVNGVCCSQHTPRKIKIYAGCC